MMNAEPCGWDATPCDTCCQEQIDALPPEQWEQLQRLAIWLLWKATGGLYGLCEQTYRPCRRNCDGSYGWPIGAPFIPWRINDEWVNLSCSTCPGECGCGGAVSEIRLPQVHAVTRLRIDGIDYTPEDTVAVYNRWRIVRIDGDVFPSCQNLASKDGIGTWSITVQQGLPVPDGAGMMAGMLACELAKACLGADDCRLPVNIQQLTRQGITIGFNERPDLVALETGLAEVDLWVASVRSQRWGQPSVRSVDRPPAAQLTWPVSEVPPPTGGGFGLVPLA